MPSTVCTVLSVASVKGAALREGVEIIGAGPVGAGADGNGDVEVDGAGAGAVVIGDGAVELGAVRSTG